MELRKQDSMMCDLQGTQFIEMTQRDLKSRSQKEARIAIFISDKI